MPIGYLDVPTDVDLDRKRELVKAMYGALHEAWPFPDDVRIFLREWPLDSVSQNGRRLVVRNGRLPERPLQTGLGPVRIEQPRVNDQRVPFWRILRSASGTKRCGVLDERDPTFDARAPQASRCEFLRSR